MENFKNEIIELIKEVGYEPEEKANNWIYFMKGRLTLGGMQIQTKGIKFHIDTKISSPTASRLLRYTDLKREAFDPNKSRYHDAFITHIHNHRDVRRVMNYIYMLLERPSDVRIKGRVV